MIKSPHFLVLSALIFVVFLYLVFSRLVFLQRSEISIGRVREVQAQNTRCSKNCGRRCTHRYDCTKFSALVSFNSRSGQAGNLSIGAGSRSGHNQQTSLASYSPGQSVEVMYDPSDLTNCYKNDFMSLWGSALIAFVSCTLFLGFSFLEPKNRRQRYSSF